jgi:threonine/homoserine efflux transporter RhtA
VTSGGNQRLMVALGIVFATMNYSFYHAIDRLPLGTVAAIEFIGPIALAVNGARTRRNALALGSAIIGVVLLTDIRMPVTRGRSCGPSPTPASSRSTSSSRTA